MDDKPGASNNKPKENGIPLKTINSGLPDDTKAYSKTYHTTIRCDPAVDNLGEDLGKVPWYVDWINFWFT